MICVYIFYIYILKSGWSVESTATEKFKNVIDVDLGGCFHRESVIDRDKSNFGESNQKARLA